MKLLIKDRLYIPNFLPKDGTLVEYSLKRSILSKIKISEEDKEKYAIQEIPEDKRIVWDFEKDMANPLDVDFTKEERTILKKGIEALSSQSYPDDFWACAEKIYND